MKKDLSLYDIGVEFHALEKLLEMDGGEITPEYELLQAQAYELLASKTDSYVYFVEKLEDEIALANEKIKLLQEFKKVRQNAIEKCDKLVKDCMKLTGEEKFTGIFKEIKLRTPVKVVNIINKDELDAQYAIVETVVNVDIKKIGDDLKRGVDVAGAELKDGAQNVMYSNRPLGKKKKTKGVKDE